MLVALTLGLMGSLGHCTGMCSGIVLLLSRRGMISGWRVVPVHLGRITTYGLLGLLAGALSRTVLAVLSFCGLTGSTPPPGAEIFGQPVAAAWPGLGQIQGLLAVVAAGLAGYLALALIGCAPSPELYLVGLTRRWGRAMQGLTSRRASGVVAAFGLGLLWGLLPCGLVLTALLTAAVTGSPFYGTLTMLAFGLGTWPALLGTGWIAQRGLPQALPWPRQVAALAVLLFGTQMALRGLAAWGWVNHLQFGGVVIW